MKKVRLGDTAKFINGAAFKPSDWADDGLPIIRIQNLTGTGESFNRTNRVVRPELVVQRGDLLVSWSATLDAYRWAGPRGVLNQHIFKVLPNDGVNPDYLYFALREVISELEQKTHGSTMKHVVRGDFESTEIPLPSLSEQERLVDLLSRAESIVRMRREAEAKSKEIIPALFVEMFGDPTANTKNWPIKALSDVCRAISDIDHKMPKAVIDGVPFISAKDLRDDGSISFDDVKMISEADFKLLSRKGVPENGDIIYSRIGAKLGKARLVSTSAKFLASYSCCTIKPIHEAINSTFLCSLLDSPAMLAHARKGIRSIGVPDLGLGEIKQFPVIVPPTKLQAIFAERTLSARQLEASQAIAVRVASQTFQSLLAGVFGEG